MLLKFKAELLSVISVMAITWGKLALFSWLNITFSYRVELIDLSSSNVMSLRIIGFVLHLDGIYQNFTYLWREKAYDKELAKLYIPRVSSMVVGSKVYLLI